VGEIQTYGQTTIEEKHHDNATCRQIVKEIMDFGVKQTQLLTIIKLLALELENRTTMESIIAALPAQEEKPKILT
jgi:hypothetical protein